MIFEVNDSTIQNIPEKERSLMMCLLDDLEELNNSSPLKFVIHYNDEGNKYYTAPYYKICQIDSYTGTATGETLGMELDIYGLDDALCVLNNYVELIKNYE